MVALGITPGLRRHRHWSFRLKFGKDELIGTVSLLASGSEIGLKRPHSSKFLSNFYINCFIYIIPGRKSHVFLETDLAREDIGPGQRHSCVTFVPDVTPVQCCMQCFCGSWQQPGWGCSVQLGLFEDGVFGNKLWSHHEATVGGCNPLLIQQMSTEHIVCVQNFIVGPVDSAVSRMDWKIFDLEKILEVPVEPPRDSAILSQI